MIHQDLLQPRYKNLNNNYKKPYMYTNKNKSNKTKVQFRCHFARKRIGPFYSSRGLHRAMSVIEKHDSCVSECLETTIITFQSCNWHVIQCLLEVPLNKKHRWLGHVLRNEVQLRDIIDRRKRLYVLSDLTSSAKYPKVKRAAAD